MQRATANYTSSRILKYNDKEYYDITSFGWSTFLN